MITFTNKYDKLMIKEIQNIKKLKFINIILHK